jgi:hypothetical protein
MDPVRMCEVMLGILGVPSTWRSATQGRESSPQNTGCWRRKRVLTWGYYVDIRVAVLTEAPCLPPTVVRPVDPAR